MGEVMEKDSLLDMGLRAHPCQQAYAPTLPGYGRSEKPAAGYSQDLWRDFLADFVTNVVRRPVVAVGNSIGGYFCASLAADCPALVRGRLLKLMGKGGKHVMGFQMPH